MQQDIAKAVREIKEMEERHSRLCSMLEGMQPELIDKAVLEKTLVHAVRDQPQNTSVLGIDGSVASEELHGVDVLLVRSCAVLFRYENTALKTHAYYPSSMPKVEVKVEYALEENDFAVFKSLSRAMSEANVALNALRELKPENVFMDGSIVVHQNDKPDHDSPNHELYAQLVQKYRELYEECDARNARLVGVIKDSRGKHLLSLLEKNFGAQLTDLTEAFRKSNDTTFLSALLKERQRTCAFAYAKTNGDHPLLRDYGKYGERISALYLRPSAFDRPLRIDFLNRSDEGFVDETAALVYALTKQHRNFAHPAVLIEADLRAGIQQQDLMSAYEEFLINLGPKSMLYRLRRNERPFR